MTTQPQPELRNPFVAGTASAAEWERTGRAARQAYLDKMTARWLAFLASSDWPPLDCIGNHTHGTWGYDATAPDCAECGHEPHQAGECVGEQMVSDGGAMVPVAWYMDDTDNPERECHCQTALGRCKVDPMFRWQQ